MVRIEDEKEEREFALRAATAFDADEHLVSYTDGDIKAGCFFALRFGADEDCVVVMKLDEFHEPINYQNIILFKKDVSE